METRNILITGSTDGIGNQAAIELAKLLKSAFGGFGAPLTEGAKRLVFAATTPDLKNITGEYLVNNRPESSKEITYNSQVQKALWKKTEEILGMKF